MPAGRVHAAHAIAVFQMEFVRLDWLRRKVLVRWHDGSEEWVPVPSKVAFQALVTVGAHPPAEDEEILADPDFGLPG